MTKFALPVTATERIDQALRHRICTAGDGSYIYRSNGRRKMGRPANYYVSRPGAMPIRIQAFTDDEAVQLANERLGSPND